MKKFVKYVLIFLLPAFILGISLELLLRRIPNDYLYKKEYLDRNSRQIRVLFLGNSHVYYDINPEFMKVNSFNASHISQPFNYDLEILKKYEGKWDSLKYIVLPVDYISLCFRLENSVEKWRIKNYTLYYGIENSSKIADYTESLSNKLMPNLERCYRYYIKGRHNINLTCSLLGWGTNYNSTNKQDLVFSGKTASLRHLSNDTLNIEKNLVDLKSILDFTKAKNIKVILYTSPTYISYLQNFAPVLLNKTLHAVSRVAANYPNAVYFSFQNDKSFVENDYYDADHLNEFGAKKLTIKMDSLVNSLDNHPKTFFSYRPAY
ncbi:MAG: hypothetical protein JWM28_1217 [Chitinophagaceae bacterium]|nr:hypothetical protein [Chitinophagaceae bacterium]